MEFDDDQCHEAGPAIMASEFDVEIGIRQRMTQTINARIAWAMLLKETLQTDVHSPSVAPDSFKLAALDALKTSDRPTEFLLDREEPPPPNIRLQEELRLARPAPRIKVPPSRNSKATFLFIRSANIATARNVIPESEFLILKCPVCSRTTFTSLQGLLNHARISHVLEWGTHEECVRACATIDPDFNVQDGIEVGVGTILPGLRTLFEMAVRPSRRESASERTPFFGTDYPICGHLTKTLGLHEDTPALAPFLGKEPIRRGIRVYGQDEQVDICTPIQNAAVRTVRGGVRFMQRGEVSQTEKMEVTVETGVDAWKEDSNDCNGISEDVRSQRALDAATTRFHFTTRIIVTDRSLSIDSDQETVFSHKWMLTVDAPSYAHNITTILRSMSVTPLSSVESVRCSKPEITYPPFIVVGLASESFLARIDLIFNNIDDSYSLEGQSFSLEHWVDLDPVRCSTAVMGEEKIYDIELDKKTHIAFPSEPPPTNYKALWKFAEDSAAVKNKQSSSNNATSPTFTYKKILNDLLPSFPLTLRDTKKRRGVKPVPYKLVASESRFLDLIEGRRKAIEWGRIRALRDALNEIVEKDSIVDFVPFTAVDVYSWMREEGHLRSHNRLPAPVAANSPKPSDDGELGSQWCSLCGLEYSMHSMFVKWEDSVSQEHRSIIGSNCAIAAQNGSIMKLRPINLDSAQRSSTLSSVQYPTWKLSMSLDPSLTQYVVCVADPRLTLEVRRVIHLLHLPFFKTPLYRGSVFPLDQLGQASEEVQSVLAPYALLAMCLRPFIRHIISSSLGVAKRQKDFAKMQVFSRKSNKWTQDQKNNVSLLTPAHVLTGIREYGRSGDHLGEAVLLCLSTIGTTLISHCGEEDKFKKPVAVKMEQP